MLIRRTAVGVLAPTAVLVLLAPSAGATDASQPTYQRVDDQMTGMYGGDPGDHGVIHTNPNGDLEWRWKASRWANDTLTVTFGSEAQGDIPVAGDYDGDRKTDAAVYRPGSPSHFFILGTATGYRDVPFGESALGDLPALGDFDGDLKADIAVVRPPAGDSGPLEWFIAGSTGQFGHLNWGDAATDLPVPGNYVGDRRSDIAIRRYEADGTTAWYIRNDAGGLERVAWGNHDDDAVGGDYDGDGRTDISVVRAEQNTWHRWFIRGSGGRFGDVTFGVVADYPTWTDVDGDGRTDVGVWRENDPGQTGVFYYQNSGNGGQNQSFWGTSGQDTPVSYFQFLLINGLI